MFDTSKHSAYLRGGALTWLPVLLLSEDATGYLEKERAQHDTPPQIVILGLKAVSCTDQFIQERMQPVVLLDICVCHKQVKG